MLRWTEENVGNSIVNIVLSLNKQAQKINAMDVDITSYSNLLPTLNTLDDIALEIDKVEGEIKDLSGYKGEYLNGMVKGFKSYCRYLQGDNIPYEVLQNDIHQLPSELITGAKIELLRVKIDKKITDLGYKGSLKDKCNNWLNESRIPPNNVTTVAKNFIDLAKKATLDRVIELPPEDGIDYVKPITGVFWSGLSVYTGNGRGNITFNIERNWSEPTFAQVLTHESYPGHQTFYCRWDYLFKEGKLPLEASYYLINSASNSLFEGAPENGLHFLGWDNEDEYTPEIPNDAKKRYSLARDYLDFQRMAQTNACYLVNIHGVNKEEAIKYLIDVGLFNDLEANNTYRYFTHPIQKHYYPTYYHGRWIIGKSYDLIPKENRAEYFDLLYNYPHTNNTFIKAVSDLIQTEFNPFK